jgi:hypothetical protein
MRTHALANDLIFLSFFKQSIGSIPMNNNLISFSSFMSSRRRPTTRLTCNAHKTVIVCEHTSRYTKKTQRSENDHLL